MPAPLDLSVLPLHDALLPGAETTEHLLLRIRVADPPGRSRPRLSAVLVLDVSGSMRGEALAHVIRSAERLAEILDDGDALGVVAFETGVYPIAPVRRLDARVRRELIGQLARLVADGSTNLSGGLAHGALALPVRVADERQLLLVMSDGHPNVGTSTPQGLAAETAAVKARGIAVSTLGFGAHHDDDVLVAVAEAGGGRYAFVNEPRLADASFARALGAQRDVVAEELHLILAPAAGVEIVRVLGNPPTSFSTAGLRVRLADAIAGDEFNVVVELRVRAPREAGPWRMLAAAVEWRPLGQRAVETLPGEAAVTVTHAADGAPRVEVAGFTAIALAGEARAEARGLADRGNYAGAAAVLTKARELIAATPGFDGDASLRSVYETLVDDITAMENRPDPEAYAKYRKVQQHHGAFAVAGARGRQGASGEASKAAEELAAQLAGALPAAHLIITRPGAAPIRVALDRPYMVIGRTGDNQVPVRSPNVSMRHAVIHFHGGAFWVADMGSTNGTMVNGVTLRSEHQLAAGDRIQVGDVSLEYRAG